MSWTIVDQEDSTYDHASDLQSLRNALEKGNEDLKIQTMQKILVIMLNGDPLPGLLMHVIRFVMPSKSKPLKKLLHFYWEICPKTNPDGKLKQEMILVCNAIRNDLQHPNEYVCGMTLRFLCKLREPELLEPLLPPCRACLEHRHSYVRKNAVFAIYSIYHHSEHLIPDAPDLILTFLQAEGDQTCKRNAFIVLSNISHQKAVEYLMQHFEEIPTMDAMMQSAVIDLICKDASLNPANKPKYLRLIFDLLESPSNTVVYEAAVSLANLTNNPAAIKASASKFIELAIKESDNNVKLIVLDKVNELHQQHEGVLEDLVMELLRVLSSPDIDVRNKALEIALKLVTSRNVADVISLLKKDLVKTVEHDYEKNNEYRQLLIHAIHTCAIRYSEVAAAGIQILMEYISEFSNTSAVDVIAFIKEVVEKFPNLRAGIIDSLLSTFGDVKAKKLFRGALWILGEYCIEEKDIKDALRGIRNSLGELPILDTEQRLLEKGDGEEVNGSTAPVAPSASRRVLADGTYATESAFSDSQTAAKLEAVKGATKPPLRSLILEGDFYLATILSSTLTKLVMRFSELPNTNDLANSFRAEAMLTMSSIIRVGQSPFVKARIDEDSIDRIMTCFRSLAEFKEIKEIEDVFLADTKSAYTTMLSAQDKTKMAKAQEERNKSAVQVDAVISIRQLSKKQSDKFSDESELDLSKAVSGGNGDVDLISSKLSRIVQLTGFSDPVYAEAFVKINKFDIILDVLLVNQTTETLQNLSLEFATLGDLKLVERPASQNVAAHSFLSLQATVKVSSADTGVIFGSIVYDRPSSTDQEIVILNDIHINVMDYIQPAFCTESQFRNMWTEFEWENKVNVYSRGDERLTLQEYLEKLMKRTNMACLTPEASLKGDCGFLSANLYAKSMFGEDALANLSVEKDESGKISGHVRIRSKGQGMALALGQVVVH